MIDRIAELVARFLACDAQASARLSRGAIRNALMVLGLDQAPCFAMYSS